MKIITRDQAKNEGLLRCFHGRPCRKGHIAERRTSDGKCIPCEAEWSRKRWEEKQGEIKAYFKRYSAENAEQIALQRRQYRQENAEQVKQAKRLFYENNKPSILEYRVKNAEKIRETSRRIKHRNAEKIKVQKKAWRQLNIEKVVAREAEYRSENAVRISAVVSRYKAAHRPQMTALTAARRGRIMKATPLWANFDEIKNIYRKAAAAKMDVDHIIPLKNSIVCGLHVQDNLQLLTKRENCRKKNKFNPSEHEWSIKTSMPGLTPAVF